MTKKHLSEAVTAVESYPCFMDDNHIRTLYSNGTASCQDKAVTGAGTVQRLDFEQDWDKLTVQHYQTGRGTLCSLDNDASIRAHTNDKSLVTCGYCLNLLASQGA